MTLTPELAMIAVALVTLTGTVWSVMSSRRSSERAARATEASATVTASMRRLTEAEQRLSELYTLTSQQGAQILHLQSQVDRLLPELIYVHDWIARGQPPPPPIRPSWLPVSAATPPPLEEQL